MVSKKIVRTYVKKTRRGEIPAVVFAQNRGRKQNKGRKRSKVSHVEDSETGEDYSLY